MGAAATRPPAAVYPRVCGGTWSVVRVMSCIRGLSPRMRGNHRGGAPLTDEQGSIPAYAGEPPGRQSRILESGVYPRVCGGTESRRNLPGRPKGLSPRMRGNPIPARFRIMILRSIPAYAGEPGATAGMVAEPGVYPRVCGGTTIPPTKTGIDRGLSPRMRGNRIRLPGGEFGGRVYPRVCGGTTAICAGVSGVSGLSPRMRGNLNQPTGRLYRSGSIPAYAGEPFTRVDEGRIDKVYPRVCGGTPSPACPLFALSGLSPRMRGNRCLSRG